MFFPPHIDSEHFIHIFLKGTETADVKQGN